MNITSFGEITPTKLLNGGGQRLGVLLKQDIFEAPSLLYAIKLYDTIYKKVDQILFDANNASPEEDRMQDLRLLRKECNEFFMIMSNRDVYDAMWKLDEKRGNTKLFRDIDYTKGFEIFPVMMTFFDLFHGQDFTDARVRVNEIANSQNIGNFLATSTNEIKVAQDRGSYARRRFHFMSKYRYVKRRSDSTRRKILK